MLVTEFGMVMLVRPEHPENALLPMLVTEFGIVMLIKPEQPENAYSMLVTVLGIKEFIHPAIKVFEAVSMIALQLSRESNFEFPVSTTILVRPEQPENAELPMLVTEFGIVTLVRLEQEENAYSPMLVTEFGIVTLVRPEQPLNAELPMLVTG